MANERKLREAIDNAALMSKLSVFGGVISLVLLLLVLILGIIRFNFADSDTFSLGVVPFSLALLFAIGGTIYGALNGAAAKEEEEKKLLEKRKASHHAFDVEEDVRFTSGRSFSNYKKYAPYALTAVAVVLMGLELYLFYRYWGIREFGPSGESTTQALFLSTIIMIISVLSGAFFVGQARMKAFRWLRPVGAWLILGFVVMLLATASGLINRMENPFWLESDHYFRNGLMVIFVLLGIELVINFVMEFYRPRTLEEPKPIFESSLLALFTEPGGVMRNIANTLDYQFGFKVSSTWIYSFFERSLCPLIVLWLAVLWAFTMLVEVGPNEVGVKQNFGKIAERKLLEPGLYVTYPWPFGSIKKVSCDKLHQVVVGAHEDDHEEEEEEVEDDGHGHNQPKKKKDTSALAKTVIQWTEEHVHEENNFLVATRQEGDSSNSSAISFLGMHMPVQFHIRKDGVFQYLYGNRDSDKILLKISEMVATEYFASAPLMEVMSTQRGVAGEIMRKRIQEEADRLDLGVEVVCVTLAGVHPPVEKVAPAFQSVIGAMEQKEKMILDAQTYAEQVIPATQAARTQIISSAEAERYRTVQVARAESERFNQQLTAYKVLPELYQLRTYLSLLENNTDEVRKFVLSSTLDKEIYELNFETKAQIDLLDADLGGFGSSAAVQADPAQSAPAPGM